MDISLSVNLLFLKCVHTPIFAMTHLNSFKFQYITVTGAKRVYPNQCKEETHAPEGEPLYKIVLDYADDQQKWFDDFIPIIHKMSANGYKDSDLKTYDFDFESMLKYVPACKNKYTNKYPC